MAWSTRFLTAVVFLGVGVVFAPDLFGSRPESASIVVSVAKLAHLLCFATAWGAAVWVTFVGGTIMFKNLSRHMFGVLQSKLFPAYFLMVSVCTSVSVAAFAYLHPWRSSSSVEKYQLGFLLSALGFDLSNLLVFTPMTIEMVKKMHNVDRDVNNKEESKNTEVTKSNSNIEHMSKKFGTIHGLSSMANLLSFGCLAIHSWYLAGKIN